MGHKFLALCFTKLKKIDMKCFVLYVVVFDKIKIYIC